MLKKLLSAAAIVGTLTSLAAVPAVAEPEPTPVPYCAGDDPGDLLNGVSCDNDVTASIGETPDPRPSDPPSGGTGPGGGDGPGGGGGPGGGDTSG